MSHIWRAYRYSILLFGAILLGLALRFVVFTLGRATLTQDWLVPSWVQVAALLAIEMLPYVLIGVWALVTLVEVDAHERQNRVQESLDLLHERMTSLEAESMETNERLDALEWLRDRRTPGQ